MSLLCSSLSRFALGALSLLCSSLLLLCSMSLLCSSLSLFVCSPSVGAVAALQLALEVLAAILPMAHAAGCDMSHLSSGATMAS